MPMSSCCIANRQDSPHSFKARGLNFLLGFCRRLLARLPLVSHREASLPFISWSHPHVLPTGWSEEMRTRRTFQQHDWLVAFCVSWTVGDKANDMCTSLLLCCSVIPLSSESAFLEGDSLVKYCVIWRSAEWVSKFFLLADTSLWTPRSMFPSVWCPFER